MSFSEGGRFFSGNAITDYAKRKNLVLKDAVAELLGQGIVPEHFRRNDGLLGAQAQLKLLDLPIFIAGCGGLGGEVATHLAQLGAGKLFLCDYDEFEESNSNRQRYCSGTTLGQSKAQITGKALAQKFPWGDFQAVEQRISSASKPDCFNSCAIIVDCLDSVSGKEMLENMATLSGKPWLHGAVLENEGFACLKSNPGGTLVSLYGKDSEKSGAGSVLSHVVAGTAALMIALFVKWLDNPDYSSPLLHADFSIPEVESFRLN